DRSSRTLDPSGDPGLPPRLRLLSLLFAGPHRGVGAERAEQLLGRLGDLVHGAIEGLVVGGRGLGEAGHLAHELDGGGTDLLLRRRRLEVVEDSYVAAHAAKSTSGAGAS